jgi:hypothetical protein
MVNNRTAKNVKGGSIYGKTRIDKNGNVILAVSPKNKLTNSVDVFERRNEEIKRIHQLNHKDRLYDFYKITDDKKNVILTNGNLLRSDYIMRGYFKSIVYMDETNKVLLPKDFARVLSSPKKKVYETEICFGFSGFNPSFGILKNRSYTINILYTKEIREIKIDRGFFYHGIYLDSTMSYNSWKQIEPRINIEIDYSYDTFWFNLFPLLKQQIALIDIEIRLMNISKDEGDETDTKLKTLVHEIMGPDAATVHEKKDE